MVEGLGEVSPPRKIIFPVRQCGEAALTNGRGKYLEGL
jgi:hypothetical protein